MTKTVLLKRLLCALLLVIAFVGRALPAACCVEALSEKEPCCSACASSESSDTPARQECPATCETQLHDEFLSTARVAPAFSDPLPLLFLPCFRSHPASLSDDPVTSRRMLVLEHIPRTHTPLFLRNCVLRR